MENTTFLAANLKLLRKRMKRSQEEVSIAISITRSTFSSYENGQAEPTLTVLMRMAAFYKVSMDNLICHDLSALPESRLRDINLEHSLDISGKRLRVLATTVNDANEDNIELVPVKAKAGYTQGYSDPDYIRVLQSFRMPFLNANRKYRSFQISGDSMPPVSDGAWVTGEYMQDWNNIREGQPYIVITKDEGIVFKVAYNRIRERGTLLLCSTNTAYEPYEVPIDEILEVWRFVHYINHEFAEHPTQRDELAETVYKLQREVTELKNTFKPGRGPKPVE